MQLQKKRGLTERRQMEATCDDVGVKHGSILQGASVPAAHSVAFLGEVCLIAFLQDGLGVLGWTL